MKALIYVLSCLHFVNVQKDNLVMSKSNCQFTLLENLGLGIEDQQLSDIFSFNVKINKEIRIFCFQFRCFSKV